MAALAKAHGLPAADQSKECKETLARSLDDLLERYLNLLDEYLKLQQQLSLNASDGYLSLARANFSNPHRIRYGQDYYDDRMKASIQVLVANESPYYQIRSENPRHLASDDAVRQKSSEYSYAAAQEGRNGSSHAEDQAKASDDPTHWFGILVPPALRASQDSFSAVAIDNIPALANAARELRELEIEVRRARKKLKKAS